MYNTELLCMTVFFMTCMSQSFFMTCMTQIFLKYDMEFLCMTQFFFMYDTDPFLRMIKEFVCKHNTEFVHV